jgi:myo-inositol-1(or 4)-monophosphatase
VGVIFDPATDSMFTAAKDMDAQLNSSRITVSDEGINNYASFGIDSHFPDSMAEPMYGIMRRTRFRNLGTTALHLAYVARGTMIGCITTVTKIWDIAAGAFIVETAGGMVTDLSGKSVLEMDPDNYAGENFVVLAANKKNHAELLKFFAG